MAYASQQESCARVLLFRGANKDVRNYNSQTAFQVQAEMGGLLTSPYCHLTLNLDSSSEGKMGVLTLRTATQGGARSGLVWCPEFEGVFGVAVPPVMEKHPTTPELWERDKWRGQRDRCGGPDFPRGRQGCREESCDGCVLYYIGLDPGYSSEPFVCQVGWHWLSS